MGVLGTHLAISLCGALGYVGSKPYEPVGGIYQRARRLAFVALFVHNN